MKHFASFSHDKKKFMKRFEKGLNIRYRHLVDPSDGKMTALEYAESLKLSAQLADISVVGRKDQDKISDEEEFCDFIKELCGKVL